jgi:hypothetical protein
MGAGNGEVVVSVMSPECAIAASCTIGESPHARLGTLGFSR